MSKHSLATILDEVSHELESRGAPIVGVRNFVCFVLLTEVREGEHLGAPCLVRCKRENFLPVEIVHGEDEIEVLKVLPGDLPGCTPHGDATPLEGVPHAGVGRFAGMGIDGSGRVTFDPVGQGASSHEVTEDVFSGGRAADIPPADEEEAEGSIIGHAGTMVVGG
jgi:hypothetical protein